MNDTEITAAGASAGGSSMYKKPWQPGTINQGL
jgi:hypothetical protein